MINYVPDLADGGIFFSRRVFTRGRAQPCRALVRRFVLVVVLVLESGHAE